MDLNAVHRPSQVTCSAEEAAQYVKETEEDWNLLPNEALWRDRYIFLRAHGYQLRPRFSPNWTPSWLGTNLDPFFCEDSIYSWITISDLIDATRISDGSVVAIKSVKRSTDELSVAQFLSSKQFLRDETNHCVPVFEVLEDPIDASASLMIMPYLRPFNNPELRTIGEVVDFVSQTLEGLHFIHSHGVAHRDCAAGNIMMDGRPLYPQGHHPARLNFSPDGTHEVSPLTRQDHPVKYYFIDFGLSSRFQPGDSFLVVGTQGRDKEPPELSDTVPYNPFPLDVFVLGNVYFQEFVQRYHGLDFLQPLVSQMRHRDPNQRPTVQRAIALLSGIQSHLTEATLRWRLRSRKESAPERVVYDTVAVAREGIYRIKQMIV